MINVKKIAAFAADEAVRLSQPFVPRDTGALMDNVSVSVIENTARITYRQPYAAINYYGGSRSFSREKNPLAASRWVEGMMASKGRELIKKVEGYANGK